MEQREYFNQIADKWDKMTRHDPQKINWLLDLIPFGLPCRVLDAGCGTGVLAPYLLKRTAEEIIGVDFAEQMIHRAEQKYQADNLHFVCADVLKGGLGRFDLIVCYSMFPHFPDKPAAIGTLAGMLHDGGRLAILHSQGREAINSLHMEASDMTVQEARLAPPEQFYRWVTGAGLRLESLVDNSQVFAVVAQKNAEA